MPNLKRSAKKSGANRRPITDLIPSGVDCIRSIHITNIAAGRKVRLLLVVEGEGYWIETLLEGNLRV